MGVASARVRALLDDATADLFTDAEVVDALAAHAHVLLDHPIAPVPQTRNGTVEWKVYPVGYGYLDEDATLYTAAGSAVASGWTLDAGPGRVTFTATTGGSVYFLSGTAHEPALAAADLADRLAARYAREYDFASDGADFKRSQRVAQWSDLAKRLRGSASRPTSAEVVRRDAPGYSEREDD